MEQENKPNLIKKLISKFKSAKIVKKLASITLALGLAISVTACTNTQNQNNNNTNTGNGTNIENPNSPNENPYAQYSELLQYVLTSDYYNDLIAQANAGFPNGYIKNLYSSNPYGFYEDEGFNVNNIKNGNLTAFSRSYILEDEPNNLYIATAVETKAATPYYTEYLLKYTLTDKEIEDYKMIHFEKYIQSTFINDAISQLKTPTIISKVRCTVEAHNSLLASLAKLNTVKALIDSDELNDIFLKGFDEENGTFEVYLFPLSGNAKQFGTTRKVATIPLVEGTRPLLVTPTDNAFFQPCSYSGYQFKLAENIDKNSGKKALIYNTDRMNVGSDLKLEN